MARPAEPVVAAKQRIRDHSRAMRAQRGAAAVADAGAALAQHGIQRWRGASLIAAYLSVGTEPPSRPLLDALVAAGVRAVVPVVVGATLDWVDYHSGGDVEPGGLGIDEPTGPRLGATVLGAAEVVIVPALAVDRGGNRLGRGRGFYDRALADVTTPAVAVVYDDELLESVPAEPHDRRVQGVLRPAGYLAL